MWWFTTEKNGKHVYNILLHHSATHPDFSEIILPCSVYGMTELPPPLRLDSKQEMCKDHRQMIQSMDGWGLMQNVCSNMMNRRACIVPAGTVLICVIFCSRSITEWFWSQQRESWQLWISLCFNLWNIFSTRQDLWKRLWINSVFVCCQSFKSEQEKEKTFLARQLPKYSQQSSKACISHLYFNWPRTNIST